MYTGRQASVFQERKLAIKVKLYRFHIAAALGAVGLQVHHRFSCFSTQLEQHFAKLCKNIKTKIQDNCYTNYNCHRKVKSRAVWMLLNIILTYLFTCSKILQGRLWTTGKNIWISVVLAGILADAGTLLDLCNKGNFISLYSRPFSSLHMHV